MDQLISWVAFPVAAVAICFGIGLLAARLARVELEPALVPAVGFAAAIALLGIVFATGIGAVPACVLLIVLAAAGLVPRLQGLTDLRMGYGARPGLGALAGLGAYLLYIAPEALTGKATFLGYNLLNDTAIHLALVDWIGEHGSRYIHQPPGSFGATINDYVASRYPLGSHELLAALKPIVGLDAALLYQPFLALCAGLAAAAIFALLRPALGARVAVAAAFCAMASQLVFSFALQGSIKELAFIVCLAAAAGLGARMRDRRDSAGRAALLALPAVALYGIYGLYALPWIAPIAVVTWLVARPPLRAVLTSVAVFAIGVAVLVPGSIHYYNHGHDVITKGSELGPLAGPLKFIQVAGVWLGGDYRFTPAHSWLTYALAVAILACALAGLVRRAAPVLLFLVPALVAYIATSPSSSPYIDAKLLVILSPAVVASAAYGIAKIRPRRAALLVGCALALALIVSDALAYRMALPAPIDRLSELSQIDARYAGRGPLLVNEYEEYVKHFMRRAPGSEPYETWTAAHVELRGAKRRRPGHVYDLDQMTTGFVERWPYIVLRRSPVASRPPSNFRRVWSGRWYQVWQRSGPAPRVHVPLGSGPFDPTAPVACHALPVGAVAAVRPQPVVFPISSGGALPPGWYVYGRDRHMLEIHKGGRVVVAGRPLEGQLWLRGQTTREDRLSGATIPRSAQRLSDWIRIDGAPIAAQMTLERPRRSLRPGDAQPDVVGPLVAVPNGAQRLVPARDACGMRADWVDVP